LPQEFSSLALRKNSCSRKKILAAKKMPLYQEKNSWHQKKSEIISEGAQYHKELSIPLDK